MSRSQIAPTRSTRRQVLTTVSSIGLVAIAGCLGGDSDDDWSPIEASGSNTVRPLTAAVAEAFENEFDDAIVNVRGPGTGAGFEEFTQGDTDIQNASRDITTEEENRAEENNVDFTRFTVGQDGLAVYLHIDNDWVDYLTVDELEAIYEFESDVTMWSDIRDEWPDEEMDIWGRDSDSGTFDYFTEAVTGQAGNVRTDYSDRTETAAVVDGVAGNLYGIGFGGWSYYDNNRDRIQAAAIQNRGHDQAYAPTPENINAGDYTPLTRPLFTFYNHDAFEREAVREFARYYFDNVQEVAQQAGFFGAPIETLEDNHDTLDEVLDDMGIDG